MATRWASFSLVVAYWETARFEGGEGSMAEKSAGEEW